MKRLSAYCCLLTTLTCSTSLTACGGGGGGNPQPQNQNPIASFIANVFTGAAPLVVSFDASASSDADGTITSFEWDFDGDGTVDLTRTQPDAQFTYATGGAFQPRLRVVDDDGASATATRTITVTALTHTQQTIDLDAATNSNALDALIVNGNPAVCYHVSGELRYNRALDSEGSQWGGAGIVEGDAATRASMAVVDGNPAILYAADGNVKFSRAIDADGSQWSTETIVASPGGNPRVELLILEGFPAAMFSGSDGLQTNTVFLLRADNAQGSGWTGTPVQASPPGESASRPAAAVISGRPAIAYLTNSMIDFIIADDAQGSSWPSTSVDVLSGNDFDGDLSLLEIDGRPALSLLVGENLLYTRASDAEGSAWPTPQTLVLEAEGNPEDPVLFTSGDRPAIAFRGTNDAVELLLGTDSAGSAFGTRLTIEPEATNGHAPLNVGGLPTAAYILDAGTVAFGEVD